MKRKLHLFTIISLVVSSLLLTGCSNSVNSNGNENSEHPTITITTRSTSNYQEFLDALKEKYPEINIEVISYNGYNTSEYVNIQLKANDISDIFVMSYPAVDDLQKDNLLDLSGYDFVSNINAKTLKDLSIDGSIYLLPTSMSIGGVWYNKTLFEKHGWEVPNSLEELEALIPQIKEAGVNVVECATQYTGATFSYFFNTNAPDYFTSLDGVTWLKEFLTGDATAEESLKECAENFQHIIDLGLLPIGETPSDDNATKERFKEGNTAFYATIATDIGGFTQNDDGTGDEYRLMPYLSKDGSNNVVIESMNFYVGLNKKVAENDAKLKDALKVMSFIASSEGQEALRTKDTQISPIVGESVSEDSPMYEVSKLIDEGKYMSMIYSGWENIIVNIGEQALAMMKGEITGDEFLKKMDEFQATNLSTGVETYAKVTETLDLTQVAQLVGAAYADATEADCAMISIGGYHPYEKEDEDGNKSNGAYENSNGVNAKLYADIPLDVQVVTTFTPCPNKLINLMTLTGKQIKEFAEEGYYNNVNDETPFDYVLVTKDGEELDGDKTYTVACVTESEERGALGDIKDSEITGSEAVISYLKKIGTVDSKTIIWK